MRFPIEAASPEHAQQLVWYSQNHWRVDTFERVEHAVQRPMDYTRRNVRVSR